MLLMSVAVGVRAAVDTQNGIFDRRFRTLKIAAEQFMSDPIISLGGDEKLVVTFDEMAEQNSWLQYRLLHCDADWQPSRLLESEYVDGFNQQDIEDFAYSTNTYKHYVNYRIELPNAEMRILHSGNYLLQVYDREHPEETLLQVRFMVSEELADIQGGATAHTDRGSNGRWQQLSVAVATERIPNLNAWQDLKLSVSQNQRDVTRRIIANPTRVENGRVVYEHNASLIYPASNEYRRFETVATTFTGLGVDSLNYVGDCYHAWVSTGRPRRDRNYDYDRTQHGRFLVREHNATDSNLGADYMQMHFRLEMPQLVGAEVYLDGEFTNGRFDDWNRMRYNTAERCYELEVPLKQGSYNYQYVVKRGETVSSSEIEGDKFETDNEYGVLLYYRPPGARADRLVGSAILGLE